MATTVLVTASATPKINPAAQPQPDATPTARPATTATRPRKSARRQNHAPDRQQFLDVKLEADAEHQENYADLGELFFDLLVGDKARRARADQEAGQQVADNRRKAEAKRDQAAHQGSGQAPGESDDQVEVAVHGTRYTGRLSDWLHPVATADSG